ncbi:MAG: ribosome maturation factor RimM [Actinomycetota bacterium]
MEPTDKTYLYEEIIGLKVITSDGREIGRVSAIMKTGANDVYYVKPDASDDEILIPAIKQVVKDIDLEAGVITIDPMPGLI